MTVYLDHAATTPLHPQVREAMQPYLEDRFGNPSSIHRYGRDVRAALDRARDAVASGLNANPREIVFTSGGTEADNMALIGIALANRDRGNHIVTTAIEHHAVLEACHYLEECGFHVTYLPVSETGMVSPKAVQEALTESTILVSIMYGNNEVGTIQPIADIREITQEHDVLLHTDAVQAFGIVPLDLKQVPLDLVSISSHKINGPKGVGALYVRKDIPFTSRMFGGSQEWKRRPGTENVPGIVGFGQAVKIALTDMEERREAYVQMRQAMLDVWQEAGIEYAINGHPIAFLPHILNVSFIGVDTEALLMNLDLEGIACGSGSACTAGSLEPSHVLQAMTLSKERISSSVRFSFGFGNSIASVEEAARQVVSIVRRLKKGNHPS